MFGFLLFIFALNLSVNDILGDENATFAADELHERSAKDGDYLGCFPQGCLHFDYVVNISESRTLDSCTSTCKENGLTVAGVYNRSKCSCSCELTCMNKQLGDESCGLPCRGDSARFCGSYTAVSVYTVYPSVTPSNTSFDTVREKDNTSSNANLKVRLVDGPDESQGRVELFYFGSWGTVCYHGWTSSDSEVVCRMLGFIGAIAHTTYPPLYGCGTGEVILRQPRCSGKESSLLECDLSRNLGYTGCGHTTDLGVSCLKMEVGQESSATMTTTNGGEMGLSQPATYGLIAFLSVAVIGIFLWNIIVAVMMWKYRRSADEASSKQQGKYPQTVNQNCYNGPQQDEEGYMELNAVPNKLPEGSSRNRGEVFKTPRPDDNEDAYENMKI